MSTGQYLNIIGSILDPEDTSKVFSVSTASSATNTASTIAFASTTDRVYIFPDESLVVAGTNTSQTLTGKTMDGASNTFTNITGSSSIVPGSITNSLLANSSMTVTADTGLSGGGLVSLGGSVSLANSGVLGVKTIAGATETGTLTLAAGTNVNIVDSPAGTFTFNVPAGAGGVSTFSAGTTGFSPSVATSGAVTLSGTLIAANGGTGFSSYAIGDLLFANTTTTLAKLADVSVSSYLRSGGVGVAPAWSTLKLPNAATTGDILIATSTNTVGNLADVAVNNALISGGVGVAPSWGKISNATLTNSSITVTAGAGLSGGGAVSLGGTVSLANAGVTSITGTTNQVAVSAATGAVILSTPSTFIAPGTIASTSSLAAGTLFYEGTSTSVSAAGATQGTATALTNSYNVVTTVAASTGVIFPTPAIAGLIITVVNKGANILNIYPAVGGTIDSAGVNTAVTLPVNGVATYQSSSTTQWYSINPSIRAGTGISVTYGNGITTVTNTGVAGSVNKLFSNTASLTVTNPGAGTFVTLFPTGVGSLTIPANTLTAGSIIAFRISGLISSLLASAALRITLGGTPIAISGSLSIGTLTNQYLCVEGTTVVYTTGVSGTVIGSGSVLLPTGIGTTTSVTTVINTTTSLALDVQFAYGALSVSNSFTIVSAFATLST